MHGLLSKTFQGSYSDLYPDSDDSSEDQIENSKNTWSCKVQHHIICETKNTTTGCLSLFQTDIKVKVDV